jgi:plasmid replication initiation protein
MVKPGRKKKRSLVLTSENWVSKSNSLNEARNSRMTPTQMKLLGIYLSKINPTDAGSRVVTFKLEDYAKIMQVSQLNTTRLAKTAEELLGLTVKLWDNEGKYSEDAEEELVIIQIFKKFRLFKKKDDGEWYVSIDCHDDATRLMFDLRERYFKYELWNTLQLTSFNQQRMYEILKQYERIGERVVTIKDLRALLGLQPAEYAVWQNFKVRVIDASQEALGRYTDLRFTWEPYGKRGRGGKVNALKFIIQKNDDYIRQMTLEDYLIEHELPALEEELLELENPPIKLEKAIEPEHAVDPLHPVLFERYQELAAHSCRGEFTIEQIAVLHTEMLSAIPEGAIGNSDYCVTYLRKRYEYMDMRSKSGKVKHRFGYLRSLIGKDV